MSNDNDFVIDEMFGAISAIYWLRENSGLILPYDTPTLTTHPGQTRIRTRPDWDSHSWNPPSPERDYRGNITRTYTKPDPSASPKPTWSELVNAYKAYRAERERKDYNQTYLPEISPRNPKWREPVDVLAEPGPASIGDLSIHVGDGIEHLDGMHFLHSNTGEPGKIFPFALMRNGDGTQTLRVYTRHQIQQLLDATVRENNIREGAKNIVFAEIQAHRAKLEKLVNALGPADSYDTIPQIRAEHAKIRELIDKQAESYKAALVKVRQDPGLPADTALRREVLTERLDAHASGMMAEITGYDHAQAANLPPSCRDQKLAGDKVSMELQKGRIALDRATDNAGLDAAYSTAKRRIEAIRVERRPVWRGPSGLLRASKETFVKSVSGERHAFVELTAEPPDQRTDTGDVALRPIVHSGDGQVVTSTDGRKAKIRVTLLSPGSALVKLAARNICGPSPMRIELTLSE